MLWTLAGMLLGGSIAFGRWRRGAVRVQGRFFPYQGSAVTLFRRLVLYALISGSVFYGMHALIEQVN